MNFAELALIGEFLGGIGVLATLIFLTLEIRNNSRILIANAKTSGMNSFAEFNEMLATDGVLPGLLDRVLSGEQLDSFKSEDQFRITLAFRALIQRIEAQYFQYSDGLVDEAFWNLRRTWLKSVLALPNLAGWWALESKSVQFSDEFVANINTAPNRISIGPMAHTSG